MQEAANLRTQAAQARGEVLDGDDDHDTDNRLGDGLALSGTFYVIWTPAGAGLALLASGFLAGRAPIPIRGALERQWQFTADASHELRTPLSIVDTGVQVLARHPDQTVAENREMLDALRQQTAHMTGLLESLLLLAWADSGQAERQLAPVRVADLVRAVSAEMELVAGARIDLLPAPPGT